MNWLEMCWPPSLMFGGLWPDFLSTYTSVLSVCFYCFQVIGIPHQFFTCCLSLNHSRNQSFCGSLVDFLFASYILAFSALCGYIGAYWLPATGPIANQCLSDRLHILHFSFTFSTVVNWNCTLTYLISTHYSKRMSATGNTTFSVLLLGPEAQEARSRIHFQQNCA